MSLFRKVIGLIFYPILNENVMAWRRAKKEFDKKYGQVPIGQIFEKRNELSQTEKEVFLDLLEQHAFWVGGNIFSSVDQVYRANQSGTMAAQLEREMKA